MAFLHGSMEIDDFNLETKFNQEYRITDLSKIRSLINLLKQKDLRESKIIKQL